MAKIPDKPQDVFVGMTQDYFKVLGRELVSIILYGSAAGGSYIKGKSDINFLIVATNKGIGKLDNTLAIVKYWQKRRVAVPLIMTKEFIEKSLDSYPIEFLNMKNSHISIYGEDVLAGLRFKQEDLRLQIEKELKGKLILLRSGYLEAAGNARHLRQLISRSFTALISIFNALIYLKQESLPQQRRDTIKEVANLLKIDAETFLLCADIKEGVDKLSRTEVVSVFKKYLQEVENICNIVDSL